MQAEYAAYTLQQNPAKEEVRGIWLFPKNIWNIVCGFDELLFPPL